MTVRQCMEMKLHAFEALYSEFSDSALSDFYRGALFAADRIFDDLKSFVPEGVLDAYKPIDD